MLDIIVLAFVLLIIFSVKYAKPSHQHEDYLDIESTTGLRGILAITIVLHHMSEKIDSGYVFPYFQHLGYLVVAVFFFLSGYGLLVSYKKKGKNYLKGFLKKRVLYLLIVYLIVSAIYIVFDIIIGKEMSVKRVLTGIFFSSDPIAVNSWYILVQLILYLFFWIVFSLEKPSRKTKILIMTMLVALLAVVYRLVNYYPYWYISNFAFVFGMLWAEKKVWIDKILGKHYILCLFFSVLCFALFSAVPLMFEHFGYDLEAIRLIFRMLSSVAFSALIIVALKFIKPTGRLLKFLGGLSLEIYLLHAMVYISLRNRKYLWVENEFLWVVLTIVITIALAWASNLLNKKISSVLKNGRRKTNGQ